MKSHLLLRDLMVDITVGNPLLVLSHQQEISVWYLTHDFRIRHVQTVHERRNLPKERVVSYGRGLAIILAALLAKIDSV